MSGPMSPYGVKPENQSYLQWLNGINTQPAPNQSTFPAESQGQMLPSVTQPQQPSSGQQAVGAINTVKNGYDTYQNVSSMFPTSSAPATPVVQSTAAQAAAPVAAQGAQTIGNLSGTTSIGASQAAAPAGMEATGQALGLSGDGVTGGMSVANSTPVATAPAASGTPGFAVGSPSYAGYLGAANDVYQGVSGWDKWDDKGADYAATRAEQQAALAVADVFTGGLAGLANTGVRAVAPHFMGEVDKFATKYGALGNIVRAFGSKKHEDQIARDGVRHNLKDQGVLDDKWNMNLAESGLQLDLGRDGKNTYTNAVGEDRPVYNIDWENDPNAAQAAGWLNPIGHIIGEGNEKLASDFVGQIYNEITKDGTTDPNIIKARVLEVYHTLQLKPSTTRAAIEQMNLPQEKKDAFYAAMDNLKVKTGGQGDLAGVPKFTPGGDFGVKPGSGTPQNLMVPPKTDIKPGPKDNNVKPSEPRAPLAAIGAGPRPNSNMVIRGPKPTEKAMGHAK